MLLRFLLYVQRCTTDRQWLVGAVVVSEAVLFLVLFLSVVDIHTFNAGICCFSFPAYHLLNGRRHGFALVEDIVRLSCPPVTGRGIEGLAKLAMFQRLH